MIDIGSCFSYGIEKLKQNPAYYIGGFLVIVGVSIVVSLISNGLGFIWGLAVGFVGAKLHFSELIGKIAATGGGAIIGSILGIIIAPFMVGYYKGIRKEYEGGHAEISDVFSAMSISVPCIINYFVANIIIVIGFICCIIPGILLSPLLNLTIFFLAKDEIDGIKAVKCAWEALKKSPILILWNIVLGIFAALGLLLCCVGILATAPIAMCATYKLFQQAIGEDKQAVPANPVQA
ncbi:MAG: hypothetical protein WAX69_02830 [Victivallales bacterium]